MGIAASYPCGYHLPMQDLKTFLRSMPQDQRAKFADRCGVSLSHIRFVAYGAKSPSCELAINIERESSGAICVESLRPDADWAVIRGKRRKAQL